MFVSNLKIWQMITATYIKDKGLYSTYLTTGSYLVDGNPLNVTSYRQEVFFKEGIKRVTQSLVVLRYEDGQGQMSVSEYHAKLAELKRKGEPDEDYDMVFNDWNDEVAYITFINTWKPVHKTVEQVGDPELISVEKEVVLETGSPFITSLYANGVDNTDICVLNRGQAQIDNLHKIMSKFGMGLSATELDYGQTKNTKKYFIKPSAKNIRYLTAFGTYPFNNSFDVPETSRGTLKRCKEIEEEDYKRMFEVVEYHYKANFGHLDSKNTLIKDVFESVNTIEHIVGKIDFKVKDSSSASVLRDAVAKLKNLLIQVTE